MRDTIFNKFPDCEIQNIDFTHPHIQIKLKDVTENCTYLLRFMNVTYFIIETDHVQNVISDLFIYDSIDVAYSNKEFILFFEKKNVAEHIEEFLNAKICYIRPIAGGEVIIGFKEYAESRLCP